MPELLNRNKGIRKVKVGELLDNEANYRRHGDDQRKAFDAAVEQLGWYGYPIVYETPEGLKLIDGHLRKEQLIAQYGADAKIQVNVTDFSDAEARLALATHDPLAAMAENDKDGLSALLNESGNETLRDLVAKSEDLNLSIDDGEQSEDVEPQVDRAAELKKQWGTERGQRWVIKGKRTHYLMCGDSTSGDDVAALMGGYKAGLVVTSPPYGQQRNYTKESEEGLKDWDKLMQGVFGNVIVEDDVQMLVNLGLIHRDNEWIPYWSEWIEWMRTEGWRRFGWYVWDQGFGLPGDWNGRFAPSFEFVFHFNKVSTRPVKWTDKQKENIKHRQQFESTMRRKDGKTVAFTNPAASGQPTKVPDSVIRIGRNVGSDGHPAQFPVALPEAIMLSWPADIIYDPFLGSGTTMLAAERLERACYGMEISPEYCAVILQRMQDAGCICTTSEEIAEKVAKVSKNGA